MFRLVYKKKNISNTIFQLCHKLYLTKTLIPGSIPMRMNYDNRRLM